MNYLLGLAMVMLGSFTAGAADGPAVPASGLERFLGSYQLRGGECAFAPRASLREERDEVTGEATYHLELLRADGGIWSSREYHQLNGAPWYQADLGTDGTVWGRSRSSCTPAGCLLWSERRFCQRVILAHCGHWSSGGSDRVAFSGGELTLQTESHETCVYSRE